MAVLDIDTDIGEEPIRLPACAASALDELEQAATLLQQLDLHGLEPLAELEVLRRLEVARRRIDHGTDRFAAHLDVSGAPSVDGLRGARAALVHLGRLSSAEAGARVRTPRLLSRLPAVSAAYERGEIPTAHVRAIARVASNPRVAALLPVADPIFAEQASEDGHREFLRWLRTWEMLADVDGADNDAATNHERRHIDLVENPDGGLSFAGSLGALEGAAFREVFDRFVEAELFADWAEARARKGDAATEADLARTPRQRRADALMAMVARAAGSVGSSGVPLVSIVIDQATFEAELARAARGPKVGGTDLPGAGPTPAGGSLGGDPSHGSVPGAISQTLGGTPLCPGEVVAAALVGHVRRVVIDADSNVTDLGRKVRLFTGSARDAALLQSVLSGHGGYVGLGCGWHGCHRTAGLQIDHPVPFAAGGRTDTANSNALCGFHNRLKEHGWRPVRGPDGRWTLLRPDGSATLPPV